MKWVQTGALVLACALVLSGLAGCNTIRGMGRDLQKGGQAIERAAER